MTSTATSRRWFAGKTSWYVLLALIPALIGVVSLAYYGVRNWSASAAIEAQLAQWERQGVPYDNASMLKTYQKRTHAEGTEDWLRVFSAVNWNYGPKPMDKLPYLGSSEPLQVLDPSVNWPEDALVSDYLKEMQPVLELIEKACQHPKPVRFPMCFEGIGTRLEVQQNSRAIVRLLKLAFEHAYYHRDTKKAMKFLELMQSTADAFDSKELFVSELVNIALRGIRLSAIQRSLTMGLWNDEELEVLRASLASPRQPNDGWKEITQAERAYCLSILSSPDAIDEMAYSLPAGQELFPLSAIGRKEILDLYSKMIDLPMSEWRDATAFSDRISLEMQKASRHSADAGVWIGMIMPAVEAVIDARLRSEENRRWVLTAVALRQFKNKFGMWPSGLRELEKLGLKSDDYSLATQTAFGYEVDGGQAYLWTKQPGQKEKISDKRPRLQDYVNHEEHAVQSVFESYVIELR